MKSSGTSITTTIRSVAAIVVNRPHFWISLIGFVFSVWGSLLNHATLYGFGYGFFGIVLASCLFTAWKEYEREKDRALHGRRPREENFD